MDPTQLRNLVKEVSGRVISTEQAANFLDVLGGDLDQSLVTAQRSFVEKHFGSKNQNR